MMSSLRGRQGLETCGCVTGTGGELMDEDNDDDDDDDWSLSDDNMVVKCCNCSCCSRSLLPNNLPKRFMFFFCVVQNVLQPEHLVGVVRFSEWKFEEKITQKVLVERISVDHSKMKSSLIRVYSLGRCKGNILCRLLSTNEDPTIKSFD